MSKGRRYDTEPKLNKKKVLGVILFILSIMFIISLFKGDSKKEILGGKIISDTYFVTFKDDKWGVIDQEGKNVIDPSYKEMIIIPNSKSGVFLCTYDVDYQNGTYSTKVLNEKNKEIFTEYDKVEALQNVYNNTFSYEKNVLKVQKDNKYGLINMQGKEIIPTEYNQIETISGIQNSFKVKKDDKFGIVDADGKIVCEPKYSDIDVLGKDNKSGFIVKDEQGKYGIIDYSNNVILENKYDSIEKVYGNDLYVVNVNNKQKLVNSKGEDVLTSGFDKIKQILSNHEEAVIFEKSGKCGVMKTSGQILINADYKSLKEAKTGIFIAQKDENFGIIDSDKNEKVEFKYSSIVYNEKADIYVAEDSNLNTEIYNSSFEVKLAGILLELNTDKGYIKIRQDNNSKYYSLKFEEKQEQDFYASRTLFLSKKDDKYGYVDKNGNVIVDYIYDDAIEQNDYGYSAVKKDGKWGSIDYKGNVVQEPIYNLEEYVVVDFIGKWHMGLDINMNYYNQI